MQVLIIQFRLRQSLAVVILLQKEKSEQQLSVLFIHKVLVLIVFTKVRDCCESCNEFSNMKTKKDDPKIILFVGVQ